ncbi:MAG: long-chain fatty acid--CoA ligase [bacterium]
MKGLMMDYQLTIPAMARRAERMHAGKPIVARQPDGTLHRTTYGEVLARSKRLIGALKKLGVGRGDRVATFCWNHHQHLEAYYGVPSMGAVAHMLNIRLQPDELAYIVNHAGDSVILVDRVLLPQFEKFRDRVAVKHVIVVGGGPEVPDGMHDYEALLAAADAVEFDDNIEENTAAGMCYTSGTTGRSKGVLYSHRSTALHSMALGLWDLEFVRERDVILACVPMFHANAWGLPYAALLFGATQVLPGPLLDPASVLELVASERVTVLTGVPTICNALLQALDAEPERNDLSSLRVMVAGGASVPEALIRAYEERHHIRLVQAWGMTETSPFGSMAMLTSVLDGVTGDARYALRATQGRPAPFVETRVRAEAGLAPWDGVTMGELEVRGPWVSSAYFDEPDTADRFTDDGWFKTGDIVSIDENGYILIRDRSKDVIKSGGEWVSSVALENMIMRHPGVLEAAVVGLKHSTWDERPLALVVTRPACECSAADIIRYLEPHFPKWWMPSGVEFVSAIPRTSVGKFNKLAMREQYRDYFMTAPDPTNVSAPSTSTTTS